MFERIKLCIVHLWFVLRKICLWIWECYFIWDVIISILHFKTLLYFLSVHGEIKELVQGARITRAVSIDRNLRKVGLLDLQVHRHCCLLILKYKFNFAGLGATKKQNKSCKSSTYWKVKSSWQYKAEPSCWAETINQSPNVYLH